MTIMSPVACTVYCNTLVFQKIINLHYYQVLILSKFMRVYDSMYMRVHSSLILHCIAYFDLPECDPLPFSFSQGPMVADKSINASVASYHKFSSVCQGLIWLGDYSTAEQSVR